MGKNKFSRIVFLFFMLAICVIGCSKKEEDVVRPIHIVITGSDLIFSYDDSFKNGVAMAVEDTNKEYESLGYKISYEYLPDYSDYEKGMIITNKLANDDKVTAVLGSHNFDILDAAAGILDDAGKIMIAPHGILDSTIKRGYENVFSTTFGAEETAKFLVEYASQNNIPKVSIVHSEGEYETTIARAFINYAKETNVKVLDCTCSALSQEDFNRAYERWKSLGVEAVVISQYFEDDAFYILNNIKARNPDIKILGDYALDMEDLLMKYKSQVEGTVIVSPMSLEQSPKLDEFNKRYEDKYGKVPTQWAAHGYDCARLVIDTAVSIGSNDPVEIAKQIKNGEGYTGIGGKLKFDSLGRMVDRKPQYLKCMDGRFEFIDTFGRRRDND
ncbi:MAG: ABC transporter substrate-binding protein [Clostridiaceae bacterium]|nr:ABC transporter substrate-binding protein [Clostridiaceae bacterium]